VYKPTDGNPINVNISGVNNAVEAGLKFTLTAYQTAKTELTDAPKLFKTDATDITSDSQLLGFIVSQNLSE